LAKQSIIFEVVLSEKLSQIDCWLVWGSKEHIQPVYMTKTKVAFLEGRLLSSQIEQFKKYSKISDWLKKAGSPKKRRLF